MPWLIRLSPVDTRRAWTRANRSRLSARRFESRYSWARLNRRRAKVAVSTPVNARSIAIVWACRGSASS